MTTTPTEATTDASRELELYVIGPYWGLPSVSPFCIKLATWLRVAGIPHRTIVRDDPRKGPKLKSPWIVDGELTLGDTGFIIEHLRRTRGIDLDARLSERERATALFLTRSFEEHFHQILEHGMFVLDEGWQQVHAHFNFLPAPIRPLIKKVIRSGGRKACVIRGIGRHTTDEIAALAGQDLRAASSLLGSQPYFFGDEPTTVDCTMYGFLAHALWAPIPSGAQQALRRQPALIAFCERMRARYWPESAGAGATVPQGTDEPASSPPAPSPRHTRDHAGAAVASP